MIALSRAVPTCAALTVSLALGAACTPSSATPPAKVGMDSSTEPSAESRDPRDTWVGRDPHASADPVAQESDPVDPAALAAQPDPVRRSVRPVYVPPPSGAYRVRVVDANQTALPTFNDHGKTYVMGGIGDRYSIMITNPTGRRVEAVVSVDGLDAMDGQSADYVQKRGYIIPAYGDATIEGFRTSYDSVATFRFSSVANSYAGRLGQARDVGVIGVAFFPERYVPPPPPPLAVAPAKRAPAHNAAPKDLDAPPAPPASPAATAPASDLGHASGGGGAEGYADGRSAGASRRAEAQRQRPGLGTEFGEARDSHIDTVAFARQSAASPSEVVAIRYNNRAGLLALGIQVDPPRSYARDDTTLRETADPFRQNRFAQPPP
jgi:hypothetical protein